MMACFEEEDVSGGSLGIKGETQEALEKSVLGGHCSRMGQFGSEEGL